MLFNNFNLMMMSLMFIFMSILGSLMSSSYIFLWMFMEFSMLGTMIMLKDAMMMYFIIQSIGSLLYLTGLMMNSYFFMIMSVMLKLAMFPFCWWLPNIMDKSPMLGNILLNSFSKINPMIMIIHMYKLNIILIIFMTILWGSIFGMQQTKIKKILGCSSITHTGWLFLLLNNHALNLLMYMTSYFLMISLLIYINKNNLNDYWSSLKNNKISSIIIILLLSGLPPFSSMWWKMIIIFNLNKINFMFVIMLLASGFNLYFYLKLIISMMKKIKIFDTKYLLLTSLLMSPQFLIWSK